MPSRAGNFRLNMYLLQKDVKNDRFSIGIFTVMMCLLYNSICIPVMDVLQGGKRETMHGENCFSKFYQ